MLAPSARFGEFSRALPLGNFGDRTIHRFDPRNATITTLFFTAGPHDKPNGLFGKLQAAP